MRIEGQPVSTAFAFKGPSNAKKLTVADLGKNGDQLSRLFSEPADFLVLQHCHSVSSSVRDHMRAFATRVGQLRPFFAAYDPFHEECVTAFPAVPETLLAELVEKRVLYSYERGQSAKEKGNED